LYEAVAEKYGLGRAGHLTRLTGGEKNLVYKIGGQNLVVRVYQPSAPRDGIEFEHRLMALLSENMGCVAWPLPDKAGATYFIWDGRPVAVMPYMPGRTPAGKDRESLAFCRESGNILGQMHEIARERADELPELSSRLPLIEMDAFSNHLYDWEKSRKWLSTTKFAPEIPYLREQLEQVWRFISGLKAGGMPLIPIHGDYYRGNLLWDGARITGVIDFDDSRMEWAEFEIARAMWEFARDDDRLVIDEARREAFLGGYTEARPAAVHDLPLYTQIIKAVRLFEILATAASMINGDLLGGWGAEDVEYHWKNLLWCKKL